MYKNNIRKLKCTSKCSKNEVIIHPISLNGHKNNHKNICSTNSIFKSDIMEQQCNPLEDQPNQDEIIFNFLIPNINIDSQDLVNIYGINNIDNFDEWIDSNLNLLPFNNINRVLNIWIKSNLNDLKSYNNALLLIIKKIFDKFDLNIKQKYIDDELSNYFVYWIKQKSYEDFDFNLIHDFKKYLNKKYESK